MKLLKSLKNIILEDRFKNPRLFTTPDDIKFVSSTHHTIDRKANLSYGEIKDIILNAIDSGSKIHTRVAVPNLMLSRLIRKKYEEIIDEFSKDPNEEKIKFIHKREDNEDEEIFDYIEFIVGRDSDEKNVFNIVSSTFSPNGNYLNLFGKDVIQSRRVMLENYVHFRTVLV